jgi:hypothetical protein
MASAGRALMSTAIVISFFLFNKKGNDVTIAKAQPAYPEMERNITTKIFMF